MVPGLTEHEKMHRLFAQHVRGSDQVQPQKSVTIPEIMVQYVHGSFLDTLQRDRNQILGWVPYFPIYDTLGRRGLSCATAISSGRIDSPSMTKASRPLSPHLGPT